MTEITPDFYYSGLEVREYIERMTKYRELFEANYKNFALNEEERAALRPLPAALHLLVVTEDWCGDAARYLPVVARMAEAAERWDIRILYRDAHPELANRWLKNGTHSAIPVLVFFDEEWNEYSCFVEKPGAILPEEAAARLEFAADHPHLPDAGLPAGEMSQPTLDIFAPYMRGFRLANTPRWQHLFAAELATRLQSARTAESVGVGCW